LVLSLNGKQRNKSHLQTTDTVDIAEQVNKYFIGVGPMLESTVNDNNEEPTKLLY